MKVSRGRRRDEKIPGGTMREETEGEGSVCRTEGKGGEDGDGELWNKNIGDITEEHSLETDRLYLIMKNCKVTYLVVLGFSSPLSGFQRLQTV